MNRAEEVIQLLLDLKALDISIAPPFTWSSGMKRPLYCDNRIVISYPEERKKIIDFFKEIIQEQQIEFDVIGGTASAAVPWASFLAYDLGVPMVYIKKQSKGYGKDKVVEGRIEKGSKILIVEDLISTGGSCMRAAEACKREYDASIAAVLAIFTYEMKESKKLFNEMDFNLHTLADFTTLIDVATKTNYISKNDKEEALKWAEDPHAWHTAYVAQELK